MKVKLVILVLLGLVIAAIGAIQRKQDQLAELETAKDKSTIPWYIRRAQLKGEKEVILPAPKVEYVTEINSIDEVYSYYKLVVAEPIEDKSFVDDTHVYTWYKFRILEDLSQKKIAQCPACSIPSDVPSGLLPLNSDEILVLKTGGTAVVENINVRMIDRSFPEFAQAEKYLLFLEVDSSGRVGKLRVGPSGVFTIGTDDRLSAINSTPHPLKHFIESLYNNNLHTLKEAARHQVKTQ